MTETLSPTACARCGSPGDYYADAVGNLTIPRCDCCAFKEGLMDDNAELVPIPPAQEPRNIIEMAIQRNMDADSIAKLVGLVEKREAAEAEAAYSEAMRRCQEEMPVVLRSKKGGKSNYAPLDDINPAIKPVYTRHGFALNFSEGDSPIVGWKRTLCDVRHNKGHHVTHHIDLPLDGGTGAAMNPIQAAISTGTYGQRVLLCRVFNITIADSDKDGQSLQDLLYITPEQASDIREMIVQNEMDAPKLLKWLGAESVEKITRAQYEKFTTTYRQRKAVRS